MPPNIVDVAIVGAGIMGAMIADRLAEAGRRVALVDRRPPAHGSTAASTALVMWEMDVPLTHLARSIGEDEAARRWRRVHAAVSRLSDRIDREGIACDKRAREIGYLAGDLLDGEGLAEEVALRAKHDLPSQFLPPAAAQDAFMIPPRAAIRSSGSYEVDPVKLTLALLDRARERGATITFPCDVSAVGDHPDGIRLQTDAGEVRARAAILAGGYERARLFLPAAFALLSSYAIATAPAFADWQGQAMLWEAADPYLYVRKDAAGRLIAGGEDEDFHDALRRDALIGEKAGTIAAKLEAMLGCGPIAVERKWAAMFGASPDGLPAIGRAASHRHLWLASGFGGNGVSFAALAAEIIAADMAGTPDQDAGCFDPYRFG